MAYLSDLNELMNWVKHETDKHEAADANIVSSGDRVGVSIAGMILNYKSQMSEKKIRDLMVAGENDNYLTMFKKNGTEYYYVGSGKGINFMSKWSPSFKKGLYKAQIDSQYKIWTVILAALALAVAVITIN